MAATVRIAGPGDLGLLLRAGDEVFDNPVDPAEARAFLDDPRHHIALAIEGGRVAGFASAVELLHPDKPPQLFVNEVGVAAQFRRRGLGLRLLRAILAQGRAVGCATAWVATETDNLPARALYARAGGAPDEAEAVVFTFDLAAPG